MTRKDYVKAAEIANRYFQTAARIKPTTKKNVEVKQDAMNVAMSVQAGFVELFRSEPNFDETRFRNACEKEASE